MTAGIFGKHFGPEFNEAISHLFRALHAHGVETFVFKPFREFMSASIAEAKDQPTFTHRKEVAEMDWLISIGGDGTLLDSVTLVGDSNVPILGFNTGRLGFLSNINTPLLDEAVRSLVNKSYETDKRALIEVVVSDVDLGEVNFALNEVTIHKKETSSMISIHTYMQEQFVNTYWADGLIVSTPTGSTAYSLSCGGPIVMPGTDSWVLTPIAPHNLNVRPLVIPNNAEIKLKAEGREPNFLLTLDSRSFTISESTEVTLRNAPFKVELINLEGQYFFNTIRTKLMWGIDRRN